MIHYTKFDFNAVASAQQPIAPKGKKSEYVNIPLAFDIETSTIKDGGGEPLSFMYIWQFGINGIAVYGRTWDEFNDFLNRLHDALYLGKTDENKRRIAVIYVHNLAFEFAFAAPYLDIENVFARSPHHVVYFTTKNDFEFRCSYFLTGKSLADVSKNTHTKKLVGDLDYNLIRHRETPLTPQELAYCENDVIVLNEFIAQEIQRNGDIAKIPLTKTGYVRREVLEHFKKWDGWKKYRARLRRAFPDLETFSLLHKCFSGGFTHANCAYVGLILSDVASVDLTSSYPTQMLKHKYPLKAFHDLVIDDYSILDKLCDEYACIMHIVFKNIRAKTNHHTISRHKCDICANAVIDNGRIDSAEMLGTFITSVDYKIIKLFYDFDAVQIDQFKYAVYDYLPKPMFDVILSHYGAKTKLKGVEGSEKEYALSKEFINSLYGMTVTNPLDDTIVYNDKTGEWSIDRADAAYLLNKQRNSQTYDLPYSVGVFVTAWARYELLKTVYAIGDDAIYCDTDSIKIRNYDKHKHIIEQYNKQNQIDVFAALDYYDIPHELANPLGKMIGVFDFEGNYNQAKFLGAKRYMTEINGIINYTVAGLPKTKIKKDNQIPRYSPLGYIEKQATERNVTPFDIFEFGLHIPREYCRKLGSVYNVEPWAATVTDYKGTPAQCGEQYGVSLEPIDFTLSIAGEFWTYLTGGVSTIGKYYSGIGTRRKELQILGIE